MSQLSAVSTSKFVKITPRVQAAAGSGFSLIGLVLIKNDALPVGIPYEFQSADAVREYFGGSSDEYKFAETYFLANTSKTRLPSAILFCNYNLGPVAAWLRGAAIDASVADLEEITNGAFRLQINGNNVNLTGLDFSGQVSYSGIAGVIQTALRAAGETAVFTSSTVSYDSHFKAFKLVLGDAAATLSFAKSPETGTDLAQLLKLREDDGAVKSGNISAAITPAEFMDEIINHTKGWFSFTRGWQLSSTSDQIAEDLLFAEWTSKQGVRFSYVEYDTNPADLNPNTYVDFASLVTAAKYDGIISNYGGAELAAFVMGTLAAVNYEEQNGRITLAFKQGTGIEITCDNDRDYDALVGKEYNCYVRDASAGNTFTGYQRGRISGDYRFADSYANHVWLNDRMQVSLRTSLGRANALPYNEASYGRLLGAIKGDIDAALNAGVINTGIQPDEAGLVEIAAELGMSVDSIRSSLVNSGWLFYAKSPSAEARADRESPILKFYYTDGGAIQKIDLLSTVLI